MLLEIDPNHPSAHKLEQIRQKLISGVVIFATESSYVFGTSYDNKSAIKRIYQLKQLSYKLPATLVCHNFSQFQNFISSIPTSLFRLIKNHIPGNYTFIFKASKNVPTYLNKSARKTIGVKVPSLNLARSLAESLALPILTSSVKIEQDTHDPILIHTKYKKLVDLVVDSGNCYVNPSSVIDFSNNPPVVLREGGDDVSWIR
ncbi:MAG: threonylcarbamoyl-AMP synthase [SAR324 cluster bacterium]|nr:threonylcarbamoyl-AMP synthase [SAR324 cluster bacterium]